VTQERLPVTVVMMSRDRREQALSSLSHLVGLRPAVDVVFVDNASTDGSADAVAQALPGVQVIRLARNRGACARNVGVRAARTPYVAFSDDDSWWAPGALERATTLFAEHGRLGLVMGRILVGPEHRTDPVCGSMAEGLLGCPPGMAQPRILGFVACGAVVRRSALLEVGGFSDIIFFPGEEDLVALDLTTAGWDLVYASDVVVHHHPQPSPTRGDRRMKEIRSRLLTAWLRRPPAGAASITIHALLRPPTASAWRGFCGTLPRLPAVIRARKPLPPSVEQQLRMLAASNR
jgi:GT2 family glycosyltransferase